MIKPFLSGFALLVAAIASTVLIAGCGNALTGLMGSQQALIKTVRVPGGTFSYKGAGSLTTDLATLSTFQIGKYEVSREQFIAVMGQDPSVVSNSNGALDPVQNVSWYEAITFCNKLSLREGLQPVYAVIGVDFKSLAFNAIPVSTNSNWNNLTISIGANGYRLPSEMEWQWAAMGGFSDTQSGNIQPGGTTGSYNYGGQSKPFAGYNGTNLVDNYCWSKDNNFGKTKPCGIKLPNELGVYDLSGNVWEWCSDSYDNSVDVQSFTISGPKSDYLRNEPTNRVLRGGSWNNSPTIATQDYFYLNFRVNEDPSFRNPDVGFRVVRR